MDATVAPMGRPKKAEPTEPMRLPRSVVRKIRRNALHRGKDPGDYAAELLADRLDAADREMIDELNRERADQGDESDVPNATNTKRRGRK
jgi:hypothetical protein